MVSGVKKVTAVYIVFVMLFSLCSCDKADRYRENSGERRHGYNFLNVCRSKDGVFYISDNMIHFFSAESAEDMLLCFDPVCKHEPAYKLNPDPKCTAALFDAVTRIAYYEERLYYLVRDGVFDTKIYRMNISGGTRELIAEIPYSFPGVVSVVFEGDYMYYPVSVRELPENSIVVESYIELIEVDITDGSYRLVTDKGKTDYSSFRKFDVYGNTLYAEVLTYDTLNELPYDVMVDLETLTMTTVARDEAYLERQYIGPYDEDSYYYCNYNTGEIGIYNMTTEDSEVLFKIKEQHYSSVMASDREIFYKTGWDGDFRYCLYDVVEDELTEITDKCIEKNILYYDGYSDIFIGYVFKDGGHSGNITGYTAYSLEEIVGE